MFSTALGALTLVLVPAPPQEPKVPAHTLNVIVSVKPGAPLKGHRFFVNGNPEHSVVTDDSGAFAIEGLSPGPVELWLKRRSRLSESTRRYRIEVRDKAITRAMIDLRDVIPATVGFIEVVGRVNGEPAVGFVVEIAGQSGTRWYSSWTLDADGRVTIGDVEPGACMIFIRSPEGVRHRAPRATYVTRGETATVTIEVATTALSIELPEGTVVPRGGTVRIALIVNHDEIRDPRNVDIEIGGISPVGAHSAARIDDRHYEVGHVTPDTYDLVISGDVLTYRRRVTFEAGRRVRCVFTLDDAD